MRAQTAVFYLRYSCHRPDLIPAVMLTHLAMLPSIPVASLVARRMGKRNTMLLGCVIMGAGIVLIHFAATTSPVLLIAGNVVANFGKGFYAGLFFALMADTVDFGEWKTGVRSPGFLFAAGTIGVKLGLGFGGAFSAWLLSVGGYVPNAEQTNATLAMIRANYILAPLVGAGVMIVLLGFYRIESDQAEITRELEQRRRPELLR